MYLTIGQVSGLIALFILAFQFLLPLAIVVILVSLIRGEYNAVTWSVIGRSLQASWLPSLFRSDSASTRRVSHRVILLSWLPTICLFLLAIAGILTPLGLTEGIATAESRDATFQYAPDVTAFGYGTPPRYKQFARVCGVYPILVNCPGRNEGVDRIRTINQTITMSDARPDSYFNTTIPRNLTEVFTSRTEGTTISGALDIQYRTWEVGVDERGGETPRIDRGSSYARSSYRPLDSILLLKKIAVLEGVIADAINGGVGYRNHTVPANLDLGGQWTEDITWIEPVTECVDTNLTLQFSLGSTARNFTKVDMVDEGGFLNSPRQVPLKDRSESFQNPQLGTKAYRSALVFNSLLRTYFGVSDRNDTGPRNTSLGRLFPVKALQYDRRLYSINLGSLEPTFLDFSTGVYNTSRLSSPASAQAAMRISSLDWKNLQDECEGYYNGVLKYNNAEINCGLLMGAPRPMHSEDSRIFRPFSTWRQTLFVCSSGIRASIKQVSFSINGTSSLQNLQVTKVQDKEYIDNASTPLWAVELTWKGMSDAKPLWGLVDNRYEASPGLVNTRAKQFWLPATLEDDLAEPDSLAAPAVFGNSMEKTYKYTTGRTSYIETIQDCSGGQNMALNRLWQSLSSSPSTASTIINLIFTEILATATVGTKSTSMIAASGPPIRVIQNRKQLQYNMLFAIPALIILLVAIVLLAVLSFCLARFFSLEALSQLLNQTSTGRLVTNFLHPELCPPDAKTKDWCRTAGSTELQFPFKSSALVGLEDDPQEEKPSESEGTSTVSNQTPETPVNEASNVEVASSLAQHDASQHPLLRETTNSSLYL